LKKLGAEHTKLSNFVNTTAEALDILGKSELLSEELGSDSFVCV
jgi:hypothetical protein